MARTTAEKPAPDPPETEPAKQAEPETEPAADAAPAEDEAKDAEAGAEHEDAEPDAEEPDAEEADAGAKAEAEELGDPGDSGTAEVRRPRRPLRDPVVVTGVVLVMIAAACAAYFGWSWHAAAHDDTLAYSRTRDAVLRAAEQGVQNMNTLDYRKVDQGLTAWEDSSTGDLHQELVQGRAQFTAQVQQAKTITTAKVLDGAVTELDDRAGRAGVIVAVRITVTPPSGTPTTKQSRMRAQLTRTPSGWKLSALGQAPVGTTADGG